MSTHDDINADRHQAEHREDNIVLNDAAFEGREGARDEHAAVIAEIARLAQGRPEDEVERIAREHLDRSGLQLPPVQVDRLVEQLVRSEGLRAVSADDGTVLHGDADARALQNPPVEPSGDPHDRPTYA